MKRWLLVLPYAALIFYLSSRTGHQLPRWWFMRYDKVLHACEYAGLAFLVTNALGLGRWWLAILLSLAFGVADEFHQTFVPGRSGNDVGDMTADLVGGGLGAAAFYGYHRLIRRVNTRA